MSTVIVPAQHLTPPQHPDCAPAAIAAAAAPAAAAAAAASAASASAAPAPAAAAPQEWGAGETEAGTDW